MTSRIVLITIDAVEPRKVADFWRAALGWEIAEESADGVRIAAHDGSGMTVDVVAVPEPKMVKSRLHLDLRADGVTSAEELERLTILGARQIDEGADGRRQAAQRATSPGVAAPEARPTLRVVPAPEARPTLRAVPAPEGLPTLRKVGLPVALGGSRAAGPPGERPPVTTVYRCRRSLPKRTHRPTTRRRCWPSSPRARASSRPPCAPIPRKPPLRCSRASWAQGRSTVAEPTRMSVLTSHVWGSL